MSTMSDKSPIEDLSARRRDDIGRDLELLLERLAESREAIVRLLATRSGDEEAVATDASGDDATVSEELWQADEIQYTDAAVGTLRPLPTSIAGTAEAEPAPAPEPEASPGQEIAPDAAQPQPPAGGASFQLPSSLRRPGPPALELALIYREIARTGGEVHTEAAPAAVPYSEHEGPKLLAVGPITASAPASSGEMPVVKNPGATTSSGSRKACSRQED